MGKVFIKVQQQYFKPEDKQMYFTKSITYTKIGYNELVEHIAKDSGMSEAAVEGAVRSILKQVEEMVLNGHTIEWVRKASLPAPLQRARGVKSESRI